MSIWIGVMATCMAAKQVCNASVTPTLFISENLCKQHVSQHYKERNVNCIQVEMARAPVQTVQVEEIMGPKVETVNINLEAAPKSEDEIAPLDIAE